MKDLLAHTSSGRGQLGAAVTMPSPGAPPTGGPLPGAPLPEVLWRRRWTVVLTMLVCTAGACAYLAVAPPIFRSAARVVVGDAGPSVRADDRAEAPHSENFAETQRDVLQSYAVLSRALDTAGYRNLKTFAKVWGDPVAWLRAGNGLDVEVPNKSDVLVVTMESRYPQEAADVANAIARAYTTERLERRRADGEEVVRVLRKQRDELQAKWDEALRSMVRQQKAQGVLSFRTNDNGNVILERTAALSAALTGAQIAAVDLRAERNAVKAALATPESARAFVESLQVKDKEGGDREYDDLRTQLVQQDLALRTNTAVLGKNNSGVRVLEARGDALRQRLVEKQREIIEGHLSSVSTRLAAAEEREQQMRGVLAAQQAQAADMSPAAVQYATLEAEAARLQRECESLDRRIADVSAFSIESRRPDAQVLEWARPAAGPVKPRAALTMLASLAAGGVLAVGMALLRESRDSRLRTPEEAVALLGTPVLAVIPRMDLHLSPVARGQMVHLDPGSQAAEAYRAIRLSLGVGAARGARTLLITSPSPGDGKSTTAGNLAVALAQSGHRTLLLDCDLRRPVQHYLFDPDGASDSPDGGGVTGVLEGKVKLRGAVLPTQVPGLYLLPCGPLPLSPSELLAGKRFEQMLETLAETFDRIVIDSPALLGVSDARSLAMLADATLLVLRMNQSSRETSVRAMEALDGIGVSVPGVIANDVPAARREQTYVSYEGSWQYASAAKPWLGRNGGDLEAVAPRAGIEAPVGVEGRPGPRRPEVLAIEDPDWSVTAEAR